MIEPLQPGYEKLAGKSLWIIDSGASRHMTGDVQVLERKTSVAPIPVSLPNGASTVANMEGSMNLSPQIYLDKVLYIPNFSCNLISVAQLTRESKCIVIFDEDLCVIQDRISKSPIGVGRLRGGVYCFDKFSPSTAQVNAVGSHNLWHGRLGHPSDQVFSLLSKDINISGSIENNVEGPCDICFRAKQTRTQFVASESHALFQLIHCDIWGAYRVPSLCGAQYF